jgi:hypothetical protein
MVIELQKDRLQMFLLSDEEEYLDEFITAHSSHGDDYSAVTNSSPHKLWPGWPNELVRLPLFS